MSLVADTKDAQVFGATFVYCMSHRRAHATGWCTVGVENKIGLGIDKLSPGGFEAATEKCRRLGLQLTDEPDCSARRFMANAEAAALQTAEHFKKSTRKKRS